jgi:hypothetical protein
MHAQAGRYQYQQQQQQLNSQLTCFDLLQGLPHGLLLPRMEPLHATKGDTGSSQTQTHKETISSSAYAPCMATNERRTWPSLWRPCSMATETSTMTAHTRATAHVGVDGRSRPPPPPAMCRPGLERSEATSRPRAEEAGCWCALALAGTHVECSLSVAGERAEQTSARCRPFYRGARRGSDARGRVKARGRPATATPDNRTEGGRRSG